MNLEQSSTTRTQVEGWYIDNYSALVEAAYEVHPQMFVVDVHNVLDELAKKVPTCRCRSHDSFLKWAKRFVQRRARQIRDTEDLLAKYRKPILAAVYRANNSWVKDESVELDDLYSEVASQIYQNASDLIKEGIAKPSTRLYALARLHVLGYFTLPRKRRHALVAAQVAAGGEIPCSISPAEIAAEKWSERESSCS